MQMVHTLDLYCRSSLISKGPCVGCAIQESLKNSVSALLAEFNMSPCSFEFSVKLKTIFNELGVEEGFWTIKRTKTGWRMVGAGFKMRNWPENCKHDPLEIFFLTPSRELSNSCALQFACMKAIIDPISRRAKGKVDETMVNSLGLPKRISSSILQAANEEWHLGLLFQNKNRNFRASEYSAYWKAPLWGNTPPSTIDVKFYIFPEEEES